MQYEAATSVEAQEVDFSYLPDQLAEKILQHGLTPEALCRKIKINQPQLQRVYEQLPQAQKVTSSALFQELHNWHHSLTLEEFTDNINRLIYLWLNAIQHGVSLLTIEKLLSSLHLSGWFNANITQLRLFLFSLLYETNHALQRSQLDWVINFDTNTQLPRSAQLSAILTAKAANSAPTGQLAVLSVQFHPFKHNLIFSNQEHVRLNQSIKETLVKHLPDNAQLFYNANLQFEILLTGIENTLKINLLAAKLFRAFEEMMQGEHQSVLVVPFIGAAQSDHPAQIVTLLENARLALESAVQTTQYLVIYTENLRQQIAEKIHLENEVLNAYSSDSLELYLQPIVDSKTRKCKGAELLLRCQKLAQYHIYPSHTIDILNKVGKGKLFTRWLANSACRMASELTQNHAHDIYLTFNLRAEDLYDAELPHLLSQALDLWKLDSKNIVLEITEEGILELNETSNSVINNLSQLGFKLALDDFGTGFSSLSRLRTMPIDLIKIDQSFIRNIARSKDDFKIVESIASLAHSLGKEVLAEGIEDEESFALIKKISIHKCQGYLFAKPMAYDDFITWLQSQA